MATFVRTSNNFMLAPDTRLRRSLSTVQQYIRCLAIFPTLIARYNGALNAHSVASETLRSGQLVRPMLFTLAFIPYDPKRHVLPVHVPFIHGRFAQSCADTQRSLFAPPLPNVFLDHPRRAGAQLW
jgi:hypothetical protein